MQALMDLAGTELATVSGDAVWRTVLLADEAATNRFGEDVAACLKPGDVLALAGDLGSGKTSLARAIVRALADDPALEVPSPTFTLVQTYGGRIAATHFDLYRIGNPDELIEIGFDDLDDAVALIEWPDRAGDRLPVTALKVAFAVEGAGRRISLSGGAAMRERIERSLAMRTFLDEAGWPDATRRFLIGDASTRAYERVGSAGRRGVLMNSPARPDGPPVRDGKPYSRIAHLAEDVRPFIAMDEALRSAGFSAPEIFAADAPAGLILLEDFGTELFLDDNGPIPERYRAAAELLAELHAEPRSPSVDHYRVPDFDRGAMSIEVDLLIDWYAEHAIGRRLPEAAEADFRAIWTALFDELHSAEKNWVLRDYHSPNVIWLPEREGTSRVGLLDFQDALFGPSAYDLASLLQDARVTVPEELENELFEVYCARRLALDPAFDRESQRRAYVIMAAQRATKVLGIFARLSRRDGKTGYLRHIPRLHLYLRRIFTHLVLSRLALWYETHLPF
jgi:tRNA threonylcarbamoyl adenosine modification protein YjeE